jgi:hypothetical protein
MGLDQYWQLEPTKEEQAYTLVTGERAIREDIGYHRKFWALQEFLQQYSKTEDFNCEDLIITEEIYQSLVEFSKQQANLELASVLEKTKKYMNEGRVVIYHGWY